MSRRAQEIIAAGALVLALSLVCSIVSAAGAAAVRKQIESSMLVSGRIAVDTQGRVTRYTLEQRGQLPAGVVSLLDEAIPRWTFKPHATEAETHMTIRVVATRLDKDNLFLRIRSAAFGGRSRTPEENVRVDRMTPPAYPLDAAQMGIEGTVYLLAKVGRDGKVSDVGAEQTNLDLALGDRAMARWRNTLEVAALREARTWTYLPPTRGDTADDAHWVVRVPVAFTLGGRRHPGPRYGIWETYVPGPRRTDPWATGEGRYFSPDAMQPGSTYLAGSGLKLLTPLSDG